MSTHEIPVIRISEILPHTSADNLELINIWGYTCVVRKNQYKIGDLTVYIAPDYNVPLDRPEFSFLSKPDKPRKEHRITVRRLRGIYSAGLLIPAPESLHLGDDAMEFLGITRYEPPETSSKLLGQTHAESGPGFFAPKYDIENLLRYPHVLSENDDCIYTAKLHGSNARIVYSSVHNKMFCGSRTQWRKQPGIVMDNGDVVPNNGWWMALQCNPWLEEWCKDNPDCVVYGEIVSSAIQGKNFHYGYSDNKIGFYAFDILENGRWINNIEFKDERYNKLQFAPTLYEGKYNLDLVKSLAEQVETCNNANHIREGVVVKLFEERIDSTLGRVVLKYVSNQYYERG